MNYGIIHDELGPLPSVVTPIAEKFAADCVESMQHLGAAITEEGLVSPKP
jgi:hypothetical protein